MIILFVKLAIVDLFFSSNKFGLVKEGNTNLVFSSKSKYSFLSELLKIG